MAVNEKYIINRTESLEDVGETLSSIPAGDELSLWIAEAAYYKAEKRDFEPGFEDQDWLEAENEILSYFSPRSS